MVTENLAESVIWCLVAMIPIYFVLFLLVKIEIRWPGKMGKTFLGLYECRGTILGFLLFFVLIAWSIDGVNNSPGETVVKMTGLVIDRGHNDDSNEYYLTIWFKEPWNITTNLTVPYNIWLEHGYGSHFIVTWYSKNVHLIENTTMNA